MNNKIMRDSTIIGFAIFATCFGAGNVIFPPAIGFASGDKWIIALTGFFLSAILLPMLSIISATKNGGFHNIAEKVSPAFSTGYTIVVMLVVGCVVGIPRIGATAHELGVAPLFSGVSPIFTAILFYGVTIYFAINPTSAIDRVGKFLTPILLVILGVIIVKGASAPLSSPVNTGLENVFTNGFVTGYQTGDGLAGVVLAGIFMTAISGKGYSDKKLQMKVMTLCTLIAATGLLLVYGGLSFVGATGGNLFSVDVEKTALLSGLTKNLMGDFGVVALSGSILFACLTTAIGLSMAVSQFFSDLFKKEILYKKIVVFLNVSGFALSILGVEKIVGFATPIFLIIYPVAMVLVGLGLVSHLIPNRGAYIGAVYFTFAVSILDTMVLFGVNVGGMRKIIYLMPFADKGFSWILPAIIGYVLGLLAFRMKKSELDIVGDDVK